MAKPILKRLLLPPFTSSRGSFHPHSKTQFLAVDCSDRDYRKAFAEFNSLLEPFGVDRIVEPGGPLVFLEELGKRRQPELTRAKFLIKHHGVKYLVLVGHHACGAYRVRLPKLAEQELDRIINKDLLLLKKRLAKILNINVSAFFAAPKGDRVKFQPL